MVNNINKLKGKMAENNYTSKRLAEELGMTENTLRAKINSYHSNFYVSESWEVKKILNLTIEEFLNIFYE